MSRRSLPPLSSLQAFEATARLGSLSAAARERHQSPSALSRAVQAVAHWNGAALFERRGPRLQLTPAGEGLLARLRGPLQSLMEAVDPGAIEPSRSEITRDLEVHTLSSLVSVWLMPHLSRLATAAPQLRIRWITGPDMWSLRPYVPAVALRVGRFDRNGLWCRALWRDHLVAVATPAWVRRHGRDPAAWLAAQRLQLLGEPWPTRIEGQRLLVPEGPTFNDALLVAQAAMAGLGVAWIRHSLVAAALVARRLVALAEQDTTGAERTLWLACRDELADDPAVLAFREWVCALPMP